MHTCIYTHESSYNPIARHSCSFRELFLILYCTYMYKYMCRSLFVIPHYTIVAFCHIELS